MAERHWSEARRYWEEQRHREAAASPDIKVTREEIEALKSYITKGESNAYVEMMRVMQHPMAVARARIYQQTRALQVARTCLSLFNRIFILVIPLVLLFTTRWWWSVAAVAFWYFVLNWIQTTVNIELGARLLAIDQKRSGRFMSNGAGEGGEGSPQQGQTDAAGPMFDSAIIGAWCMEKKGRDYATWSAEMLSDESIRATLNKYSLGDKDSYLWKIYNWSNALLVACYYFKEGAREFDAWRNRLLLALDEQTGEEIGPYLREIYRLVGEMEKDIDSSLANKPLSRTPQDGPYDPSRYTVRMRSKNGIEYFYYYSLADAYEGIEQLIKAWEGDEIARSFSVFPPEEKL